MKINLRNKHVYKCMYMPIKCNLSQLIPLYQDVLELHLCGREGVYVCTYSRLTCYKLNLYICQTVSTYMVWMIVHINTSCTYSLKCSWGVAVYVDYCICEVIFSQEIDWWHRPWDAKQNNQGSSFKEEGVQELVGRCNVVGNPQT